MPGINPSVITHRLNVTLSYKPYSSEEKSVYPKIRQCHKRESPEVKSSQVHLGSLLP